MASTNHTTQGTAPLCGTSATDAAIACSRLPVLARFRPGVALWIGILAAVGNLVALIGLTYYFRTSCDIRYATIPNQFDAEGDTPEALSTLANQPGITIRRRSMVYYKDETFTQRDLTFWEPEEWTCGCPECHLASCVATIPINVEYEECNPWFEAFSLATALLVYVQLACTIALVGLLATLKNTCIREDIREDERPHGWDYVRMLAGE